MGNIEKSVDLLRTNPHLKEGVRGDYGTMMEGCLAEENRRNLKKPAPGQLRPSRISHENYPELDQRLCTETRASDCLNCGTAHTCK
jgi:hypothetical protein